SAAQRIYRAGRSMKRRPREAVPQRTSPEREPSPALAAAGVPRSVWEPLAVVAAVAVCLLPFIGKAFHIADPLFLWVAKQIQAQPANPYGFTVNWYGFVNPIAEITKNPPLASYYLALLAGAFGWSEAALHLGFLLLAAAAALAAYFVARELCGHPLLAA